MSEPASALQGATFSGAAHVAEAPLTGMITLRGDLNSPAVAQAVEAAVQLGVPERRGILSGSGALAAWMSPDELLLILPYAEVEAATARGNAALGETFGICVNVSDARAMFNVTGAEAREALAKLVPVDLHPGSFATGEMRRTRLAQVPAAIWQSGPEAFHVICFRSVARYAFDILCQAIESGTEVGAFPQD